MLYALADKFLSAGELNEIKEVLAMTRLGQMLYDDGVKKGMERGRELGRELGREEEARQNAALTSRLLKKTVWMTFRDLQEIKNLRNSY